MRITWNKWTTNTIIVAFATYWTINLLLWYPWSYSAILGMTLMFVAITPIWISAIFFCLKRYPGEKLTLGAAYTSFIFSLVAIVLDYIFFGVIQGAMTELYHPTTLYGYAFLAFLPFGEIILFKKQFNLRATFRSNEIIIFGVMGLASFITITLIISFNVKSYEKPHTCDVIKIYQQISV